MRSPWCALLTVPVVLTTSCAAPPLPAEAPPLVELLDPRIGTGGFAFGYGAGFFGAAVPHGLVKVGPDTTGTFGEVRFVHTSGHWSEDPTILCFSHTHLHGVGLPEGGAVALMPTTSFASERPRATDYQQTRVDEDVDAGGYRVRLQEEDILVELAATARTAHHRITFPDGTAHGSVVLDLARVIVEGEVSDARLEQVDDTSVRGQLFMEGSLSPPGGYTVFFVLVADSPFIVEASVDAGAAAALPVQGETVRAALHFGPRDTTSPVQLRVGLSLVDGDGAARNLATELPAFGHDDVVTDARDAWAAVLGRVRLFGGSDDDRVQFASALYRQFLMPSVLHDVDGRFVGPDGGVHVADGFRMMTDLSLWDTYRSVQPLYALVAKESARDVGKSLLAFTDIAGFVPLWTMATGDASVMIGAPGEVAIADALMRGALDVDDVLPTWPILRAAALDMEVEPAAGRQGRRDTVIYDELGYVPTTRRASVSSTLEYNIDDTALAHLAAALGAEEDAARLLDRAAGWQLLYDVDTGFLRGRDEAGAFRPLDGPFEPTDFGADYVEASAWQSTFPVDDVAGIEAVYGGRDGARAKLRELLTLTQEHWATVDTASELFGAAPLPFHWQGNEPSLHVCALPFDLGDRALGREYVEWVRATQYHSGVAGVPGNDDGGATSAWLIEAMLGLHPIAGSDAWVLGQPLFPRVEVDVDGGVLAITRDEGATAGDRVTFDGVVVDGPRIGHGALMGGGDLHFAAP
ncbi:MAG: GH92 family glycosyl hydrolase [Deltaproteobacteria bacterium]|nr:GH92 family glycosyl hydrolase [Deltaproteobacteria bacterium]